VLRPTAKCRPVPSSRCKQCKPIRSNCVQTCALAVATVLRVTLSIDHRPVDGVNGAQWMKVFLDLLEHPAKILS
jgi:pyruvate/2-oxoglutarate dehydrogenase complex dihydrolipoamide acyltransferase (E2) component